MEVVFMKAYYQVAQNGKLFDSTQWEEVNGRLQYVGEDASPLRPQCWEGNGSLFCENLRQ